MNLKTYFDVFRIATGKIGHISVIKFLRHETWADTLSCVRSPCFLSHLTLSGYSCALFAFLAHALSLICLSDGISLSLNFTGISGPNLFRSEILLLFHWSCSRIRHLVSLPCLALAITSSSLVFLIAVRVVVASHFLVSSLVHTGLLLIDRLLFHLSRIGSICNKRWPNKVNKHWLSVEFILVRFSFLNYFINTLA